MRSRVGRARFLPPFSIKIALDENSGEQNVTIIDSVFLKPAYDNFSLSYNSKTTLNLENNNWFFNPGAFVILTKYILWKGTRPCPFAVTDTGCWANKSVSFILAYWDCSPYMIFASDFHALFKGSLGQN